MQNSFEQLIRPPTYHTTRSPSQLSPQTPNSLSPSALTPFPSLHARSSAESQLRSSVGSTEGQIPSATPPVNTQSSPSIDSLHLPIPSLDPFNPVFAHDLVLSLPESFPKTTPGDEFLHVKLASKKKQQEFIEGLTRGTDFIEMSVTLPDFLRMHDTDVV